MQIKASEFTELIMKELKKKKKKPKLFCSYLHIDTIVKSPFHTNPDIFKSAFIYVSVFRLVFRSHTKPGNPLTETLG